MTYGEALEIVKKGRLVHRRGWNGKNMFVFMRPADELSVDMIVNKVKSLPQSFKDYIDHAHPTEIESQDVIKFTAYLCMKNAQGEIMNGWIATQTDALADDWEEYIIDEHFKK